MAGRKRKLNRPESGIKKRGRRGIACKDSFREQNTESGFAVTITTDTQSWLSVDDLPNEAMQKIISFLPNREWPVLERVNRRFQSAVIGCWRDLRRVDFRYFRNEGTVGTQSRLTSILLKLAIQSPMVESLREFDFFSPLAANNTRLLVRLNNLKSVDLSHCHIQVRYLARFLAESASRSVLKELRLVGSLRFCGFLNGDAARDKRALYDELLQAAILNTPDRPPLRLKTFVFHENNSCDGAFLDSLDVSSLETLSIVENQLRDEHLARLLNRCTQLVDVFVDPLPDRPINVTDGNQPDSISEEILRAIGAIPAEKLTTITFSGLPRDQSRIPSVYGEFATALSALGRHCRLITDLNVSHCTLSSTDVINAIAGNFHNLEVLNLNVDRCSASSLTQLAMRLNGLKRLGLFATKKKTLTMCPQINGDVVKSIALNLKHLTSLHLEYPVFSLEDAQFLSELTQLKELCVSGSNITNDLVLAWCNSFGRQLESLRIWCERVSDSGVAIAARKLSNIRRFSLDYTAITDVSLRSIATACPHLEELSLAFCQQVTKSGIRAVINSTNKLRRLEVFTGLVTSDLMYNQNTLVITTDRDHITRGFGCACYPAAYPFWRV